MYTAKQVYEEKISFKPMSYEEFVKLKSHFEKLYPGDYCNCDYGIDYYYRFYPDVLGNNFGSTPSSYLTYISSTYPRSTKEILFEEFDFEEFILPKKWYLNITNENRKILNEWRLKQPDCKYRDSYIDGYLLSKHKNDSSYYYDTTEIDTQFSFFKRLYNDYIKITFEQFEKYVLKQEKKGKLAFKGFDRNLKCRGVQFCKGITYSLPNLNKNPQLCTPDGFHYCNKLSNVFNYYNNNSDNRFCIIEILDSFNEDKDKGITYSFRIIRELTQSEIDKWANADKLLDIENEDYENKKKQRDEAEKDIKITLDNKILIDKAIKDELTKIKQETEDKAKAVTAKMAKNMRLDLVRKFQKQYPHTHICGSVGLFLHGIRLDRFYNQSINDFDIITPYYTKFEDLNSGTNPINISLLEDEYTSGCDFGECILIGGIKADIRIDNQQKYDIIEFEGFKYKVSALEAIWAAKLRYNAKKHNDDLREAMHLK